MHHMGAAGQVSPQVDPNTAQRYELLEAKLHESGFDLRCRHK